MTARVKYGTLPWTRPTNRSVSVLAMSPRTVQHRQPLFSSTTSSVAFSTSRWSRPISPNSLTMTAVEAMPGSFSTWFSSVVLPLPRNPVSTVTGMRDKALLAATDCSSNLPQGDFPVFRRDRRGLRASAETRTGTLSLLDAYHDARGFAVSLGGDPMYPFVYWTGVMTLLVWSAYSAYSAFIG